MAWDVTVVNTLAESYSTVSVSPGGAAEHAAARKTSKYSSPGFTYVSTAGSRDPWSDKLLRHRIPGRAGPTINGRFWRRTRNHVFISKSFSGGPALQFGRPSLQRNLCSIYRIGLAPLYGPYGSRRTLSCVTVVITYLLLRVSVLLGGIALAQAILPITTHFSAAWSVCLSVCRLSHLSTLPKPFDGVRCYSAATLVWSNDTLH